MQSKTGRLRLPKETKYFLFFTGPAILYMLILAVYPVLYNFYLMFRNMSAKSFLTHEFVGLETIGILFSKGVIWTSISNTLVFTVVCTIIQFIIGFGFAMLLHQKFSAAEPVRGFMLISWLIPMTVTGILFKFIFQTDTGILNFILCETGLAAAPVEWLTQKSTALLSIIIANCWVGIPFDMVLINTGLSNIPDEMYESASIDGANRIQQFFRITVPMIRSSLYSILILGVIYTFKVFDLVQVMTAGGPVNATELMATYAYKLAFKEYNFSQASVVANVMFVLLFIVGLFYRRFIQDDEVIS